MGDLHLVLPALNLTTLDVCILIMVQQVRMMMFSLNMVDYFGMGLGLGVLGIRFLGQGLTVNFGFETKNCI